MVRIVLIDKLYGDETINQSLVSGISGQVLLPAE